MKKVISFAFLAFSITCFATTYPIVIYKNGGKIGTGSYTATVAKGIITETLKMKLKGPQGVAEIVQMQSFKPSGLPVAQELQSTTLGQTGSISVKYVGRNAIVDENAMGQKMNKTVAAPSSGSITDPSSAWFKTVSPKVGAEATALSFNPETMTWTTGTTTFVRDLVVTVNNHSYNCHYLKNKSATETSQIYLDSNGDIVKANFGGLIIERS